MLAALDPAHPSIGDRLAEEIGKLRTAVDGAWPVIEALVTSRPAVASTSGRYRAVKSAWRFGDRAVPLLEERWSVEEDSEVRDAVYEVLHDLGKTPGS